MSQKQYPYNEVKFVRLYSLHLIGSKIDGNGRIMLTKHVIFVKHAILCIPMHSTQTLDN